ncbi:alpha-L-glutamate ligase-like protein [Hyphococcus lacteus]|uniref:Alpha-L-glutamate ligase-like protein n=1 Tax=Hyphococcus lacteus TaxID=3143536 RepID=A0ABV3Z3C1_9PROT
MFKTYSALKKNGVIGINERNVRYVSALNPRKFFYKVDDKEVTKTLATAVGIPTPELYGVIKDARDMKRLSEFMDHPDGFVIKPAQGSQGKGIFVVEGPLKGGWRLSSGRRVDLDDIKFQINNMLSGMYSLGGQPDKALIEYRVKFDDVFGKVSYKGVPDIRVIALKGIPIFSMVRLPTAESDGKANLHKGGVGVGVNIATGLTARAMQFDRLIEIHPDTAHPLEDIQAPFWDDILLMAAKSYDVTGLGYIGVDVVLDREKGPLLLELNARPGISIQIANRRGMREVLERAMALSAVNRTASERVKVAKELALELNPLAVNSSS